MEFWFELQAELSSVLMRRFLVASFRHFNWEETSELVGRYQTLELRELFGGGEVAVVFVYSGPGETA